MGVVQIDFISFLLVYVLLLVVYLLMKLTKIKQERLLVWASFRMSVQLILVGYLLTYILEHPLPIYTIIFLGVMYTFSFQRIFAPLKAHHIGFKAILACSLFISSILVLLYFVVIITGQSFFDAQYTIPLAGMIVGNSMTGINIGMKTFLTNFDHQRAQRMTLLNLGVHPKQILKPMADQALETALIPTLNSMLGMGVIFLPGMMTGQILSGTIPTTAIVYQIAIMIAIATSVSLSLYFALYFGIRTMYTHEYRFIELPDKK